MSLKRRVDKMEDRLSMNPGETLSDWIIRRVEQERAGLSPEARAELEGLEATISEIQGLACERAGVQPPRRFNLENIFKHAEAVRQACKEHLVAEEKESLARAQARRAAITGHGGEDQYGVPYSNTAVGLVRTKP